ncbi:MAG: bifunctional demethylmenaquinone methyltransferase/2-methoxy-6-polyprenyl-1,4-benzoquinol methylase UbiE [Planctomycetota bacterium]|nr:bifunctional demethylmenaquinone methyltransferase/2-methoxy-6-polyprenyl-1,4-benzoquinol methylase UbiE [Planctomycetota bacterium]
MSFAKTPLNPIDIPSKMLDKSGDRVRQMFAEIAPKYDLMNHVLSLNIDRLWRARTIRILGLSPGEPILDVCTGTGDLTLAMAQSLGKETQIVGSDFCVEMLQIARKKQAKKLPGYDKVDFIEADTQELPFPDNHFQAVTVAFGLRNVAVTEQGLSEMRRVCKPGGRIAVLEFSKPTVFGLRHVYNAYFKSILPRVGQSMSKNKQSAYDYLPQSVQEFPSGEALANVMRQAELTDIKMVPMTFGVVTLYIGTK